MMSFPEFLKKTRESKHYTIRRLALRSNVSPSSVSRLEHGQFHPSLTMLKKLSKGLNIPEKQLFYQAGYIDHPYTEIDVSGLPQADVDLMDQKFLHLNKNKEQK